jgi:aspartate/tyrosine/aromatic aminotransferase
LGKATILCAWTASKAYAQYGARIGALVAIDSDPEERQRIKNALAYSCRGTWSNCNHLGMLAITELIEDPGLRARSDQEREGLRALLQERVHVFNGLARKAGLSFPRYEGGFFVSVFTPRPRVTSARMQEHGVFVVPLEGAVRIAMCSTPARDVPRLVEALVAGVRAAQE